MSELTFITFLPSVASITVTAIIVLKVYTLTISIASDIDTVINVYKKGFIY